MPVSKNPPFAKPRSMAKAVPHYYAEGSAEILMVEDSATDAELALRAFKRANIANPLKVVFSGEQALDYLRGSGTRAKYGVTRPLLILLDLNLPGMSGIDFLREIKGDPRTSGIPVATLSLTQSAPAIVACLRLGAADHIIKPVDFKALVRVTKKLKLHLATAPPAVATGGPVLLGGKAN